MVNTPPIPPRLAVRDLTCGYGEANVLSRVTLTASDGELVCVGGANGSGKTSLMRAITGLLPSRGGVVLIQGVPVSRMRARQRSRMVACVPQSLPVAIPFSVREFVCMGRTPYLDGLDRGSEEDRQVVERALADADLRDLAGATLDEISAGERQRAMLAMALAQRPGLLLLDEPTAHLDLHHAWQFMYLLHALVRREGLAAVVATHDVSMMAALADRVVLLRRGAVVVDGRPTEAMRDDYLSETFGMPLRVACYPEGVLVTPKSGSEARGGAAAGQNTK